MFPNIYARNYKSNKAYYTLHEAWNNTMKIVTHTWAHIKMHFFLGLHCHSTLVWLGAFQFHAHSRISFMHMACNETFTIPALMFRVPSHVCRVNFSTSRKVRDGSLSSAVTCYLFTCSLGSFVQSHIFSFSLEYSWPFIFKILILIQVVKFSLSYISVINFSLENQYSRHKTPSTCRVDLWLLFLLWFLLFF